MLELARTIFWLTFKLVAVGFAILFVGLVVMTYKTDGSRYRPKLDFRDPGRSVEALLIWLGVKVLSATLNLIRSAFQMLSDTCAELGVWLIRDHTGEVRESIRSRFLV